MNIPCQETFLSMKNGDDTIKVLKTYDQTTDEGYQTTDEGYEDFIWEFMVDPVREDCIRSPIPSKQSLPGAKQRNSLSRD